MRKHAGTKCMRARAWATWVLRVCVGDLPTRCPPFASSKDVEEEVDE